MTTAAAPSLMVEALAAVTVPSFVNAGLRLGIFSSLTDSSLEKSVKEFSGQDFSKFKEILSQVLIDKINPISIEIRRLLNDKNYLDQILFEGSEKANVIASKKIEKIHEILGF